jgi:hypothetical protein
MAHAGSPRNGILRRRKPARDVEAVLASDSIRSSSMPCTAICRTTGATISAVWRACALQRLHPHALLLPERAAGYVFQRERRERACAAWFAIPGPVTTSTAWYLVTGRAEGKGTPEGSTVWIPDAAGAGIDLLRWEDKLTLFSRPTDSWI